MCAYFLEPNSKNRREQLRVSESWDTVSTSLYMLVRNFVYCVVRILHQFYPLLRSAVLQGTVLTGCNVRHLAHEHETGGCTNNCCGSQWCFRQMVERTQLWCSRINACALFSRANLITRELTGGSRSSLRYLLCPIQPTGDRR